MRGTAGHERPPQPRDRFSPAHAGNSYLSAARSARRPVQPRACGEQGCRCVVSGAENGSAPRMRGTVELPHLVDVHARFSPAHAGNSSRARYCARRRSVQPRACGEQSRGECENDSPHGSAPRMRGTADAATSEPTFDRFSPAHAGNRCDHAGGRIVPLVQPRACGEQISATAKKIVSVGSAPRMRGTVGHVLGADVCNRFSPAHAGNSPLWISASALAAVQPRACGEQTVGH